VDATSDIYTLSLHDALPIYRLIRQKEIETQQQIEVSRINQQKVTQIAEQDKAVSVARKSEEQSEAEARADKARAEAVMAEEGVRSEEHTSELQSRENLVCRL